MLLAIDTSTRYASVALATEDAVLASRTWHSTSNHTESLMPEVASLLGDQQITPAGLSAVAVALGPGGFSALRVGISVAKGLCVPNATPLIGVGTLDLEAFPYLGSSLAVCSVLDAGRNEISSGFWGVNRERIREDRVCTLDELLKEIVEELPERVLLCGEGLQGRIDAVKENVVGRDIVVAQTVPAARVWSLVALGWRRLGAGETDDAAALQPYYLRMPSIGGPKRRDRVQQSPHSR